MMEMKDLFAKPPCFSVHCYKGTKHMKKTLLFGIITLMVGLGSLHSYAQDIAEQPCDPQYWRQMSARAWLESEREIMQNQNLIFKPDSVLEYVCFDQFASIAAWPGGDIFVHTDYFGKKIITRGSAGAMEKGIYNVVSKALDPYKGNNFNHSYLGGRSVLMSAEITNSSFQPALNKQNYTCQTMSKIWKAAKCANFVDNSSFETTDGFYPFKAIKKFKNGKDVAGYEDTIKETRVYPASLKCSDSVGAAGSWKEQNKLAENESNNLYKFQEPLGKIFKEVGEKLKPGECGKKGIETGIMVIIDGKESHKDGVCTNPGCTYTKGGTCS